MTNIVRLTEQRLQLERQAAALAAVAHEHYAANVREAAMQLRLAIETALRALDRNAGNPTKQETILNGFLAYRDTVTWELWREADGYEQIIWHYRRR